MRRVCAVIFAIGLIAGCAARARTHEAVARGAKDIPATRPATKADLSLEEIEPRPVLAAATNPSTTQATTLPTLENLALFAEARDAMLQNKRYTATNLLEKAIQADPNSYELHFALGQVNAGSGMSRDTSIAAFEAAAALEPDHIAPYTELGRLYVMKGEVGRAIECLRLARQTTEYERDDSAAAVVDFYLGKALQQDGYDLAALECYGSLVNRLQAGRLNTRGVPELAYLAQQPEALFVQVAELYERRGLSAEAIELYRVAAERKPEEFGIQARLVRALANTGKRREATERAAAVCGSFARRRNRWHS